MPVVVVREEKTDKMVPSTIVSIQSQCACGGVCVKVSCHILPPEMQSGPEAVDCHCPTCRKFHVASFVSYVVLPYASSWPSAPDAHKGDSHMLIRGRDNLSVYRDDYCGQVGPVERWYCQKCLSKLFTRVTDNSHDSYFTTLLNMGPIIDQSVPSTLLSSWQQHRRIWQGSSKSIWTDCRPAVKERWTQLQEQMTTRPQEVSPSLVVHGSCACHACSYEIDWSMPTEVHHCYCRLCRQLSGGAFQSWVPVLKSHWKWFLTDPTTGVTTCIEGTQKPPSSSALSLRRTTLHGQRHCCRHCGSAMTIVYDCQSNHVWPAMGGFDDIYDPLQVSLCRAHIHRVVHIGCRYKQGWYALPDDGLEKRHWYDWSFQVQSRIKKFLVGINSMFLLSATWQLALTWIQNYQEAWLLLLEDILYVHQNVLHEQNQQSKPT